MLILLISQSVFAEVTSRNENKTGNQVSILRKMFRNYLKNPDFLLLDPIKQQQALIAFYDILQNPPKNLDSNTIDLIIKRLNKKKVKQERNKLRPF